MGKYTSMQTLRTLFDGELITVEHERLSFADALMLRDNSDKSGELVLKYVKKIDGLYDAEDKPIPLGTVVRDFYFASLVVVIVQSLFATGGIEEDTSGPFGQK